tara:strand:+ start:1484 stop:1771 length:288 start_codon:yes stop_codon:yes gene_type:complete
MKVIINKSTNKKKKFVAIFYKDNKKIKTTHFGNHGSSDFTINKNKETKKNYLLRHKPREDWNAFMTAGSLSRYILWNKPTLKSSIADYKKRFSLL